MTRTDRILVLALAVVLVASWPLAASAGDTGRRVEIVGPAGTSVLDLSEDRSLVVEGRTGELTVIVQDGTLRVGEAECPDHVCEQTGRVSYSGEVVACIPNGVIIRVLGGESDEFDARIR